MDLHKNQPMGDSYGATIGCGSCECVAAGHRDSGLSACTQFTTAARRTPAGALVRYYVDAGAGGLAVGVHTTQFAIRDPQVGLLRPVLELAAEELHRASRAVGQPLVRIAGVCGLTPQAVAEAELATGAAIMPDC